MKKVFLILLLLSSLPLVNGCDNQPSAPVAETPQQKADIISDRLSAWMGKWDGPEGTYLKLEKSGEGYGVIIRDLDKEERYLGVASDMRIRFHRENKEEYIRLAPGRKTGVKWLLDKPYCLMIKQGEAYCRDKI